MALNVTATQAEDNGFLTVYPNGQPLPVASNVNYTAGADVPNLVVATLGTDGSINIFSEDATHVIVDIFGWFGTNATNGFVAAVPTRVFDSRSGPKVGAGQVVTFPVVGLGGVPAGTPSVALNLTIDRPDAAGFASVFASGYAGAGDLERQLRGRPDQAQRGVRSGRGRRPGERVRVDRGPRHRRRARVVQHRQRRRAVQAGEAQAGVGQPSAHHHPRRR